jgi:hypothetical protein
MLEWIVVVFDGSDTSSSVVIYLDDENTVHRSLSLRLAIISLVRSEISLDTLA